MQKKSQTIKKRLSILLLPLILSIVFVMTFISYGLIRNRLILDYANQRDAIEAHAISALDLIDTGFGMLDLQLENEMTEVLLVFKSLYESADRAYTLEEIKEAVNPVYDYMVINDQNTIHKTTRPDALGFNFNDFDPDVGEMITEIRFSGHVFHERIRTNVSTGLLSKFSYLATTDGSELLEIAYSEAVFSDLVYRLDPVTTLEALASSNPVVSKIEVYDVYGYQYTNQGELYEPTEESISFVEKAKTHGSYEWAEGSLTQRLVFIPDDEINPISDHSRVLFIQFSTEPLKKLLNTMLLTVLGISIVMTIFALYLISKGVKSISRPLADLSNASQAVAAGKYEVKVPTGYFYETDQVAKAFNQMIVEVNQNYATIENRFKTTLLSMGDALIVTDAKGNIEMMNKVAKDLCDYDFKPSNHKIHLNEIFKTQVIDYDEYLMSLSGKQVPIEYSKAAILDAKGASQGQVIVFRDVTETKEKVDRIEYLSHHDTLTGVYNRHFFDEEIRRFNQEAFLPLTLIMLDVNGLKLINDALGHKAGDALLKIAADSIQGVCRDTDALFRIGGDEFVLLLPNTDKKRALEMMEELKRDISQMKVDDMVISISYGLETKSDPKSSIDVVFKVAEDHMYRRKLSESLAMRHEMLDLVLKRLFKKRPSEKIHAENVRFLCEKISRSIDMSSQERDDLLKAAYMHDIGKIAIDLELLDRTSPLNEAEQLEIERHPEIGYQLLKSLNAYSAVSEIVLSHHENWDGSGYPRGIAGSDIPLGAQIIALVQYCNWLQEVKKYDQWMVLEALKEQAGKRFNPELIAQITINEVFLNE